MNASTCDSDLWVAPAPERHTHQAYGVAIAQQLAVVNGSGPMAFELRFQHSADYQRFLATDVFSAARAFVEGRFDIRGDVMSAVSFKASHPGEPWQRWKAAFLAAIAGCRVESLVQSRLRARRNIEFHYDRSNDFYAAFLDSRMVYSCAYFETPEKSLDDAQLAKLDLICRKLDLRPDESFLDIGCGWGALLMHAAAHYGAVATGCTLSTQQIEHVRKVTAMQELEGRIAVENSDLRQMTGSFNKVASVGMFEHVGRKRLHGYFKKVFDLMMPDGLFLNHGIIRPQGVHDGPETRFLRDYVFPGGELAHLADVVKAAEDAGFEVLDVENLRPHYAMTCRHWVQRLMAAEPLCLKTAGRQTYRTWLLYLAASSLSFQEGQTDIYQILLAKRSGRIRHLTREYILRSQ